jgi:aspartyl-tRNA(Asn)/glutamyl-tRNA(Gln) amidotransferase subunit A
VDPSTRDAFRQAIEVIRSIGVELVEVKLPDLPYGPVTSTIISAEGASSFETLITSGKVDELADKRQIAGLKAALDIPSRDYLKAMRIRRLIQQGLREVLTDVDVILSPGRYTVAPKINEPLDKSLGIGDRPSPSMPGMRSMIPAGNLAGLPAISLPCGLVNNLPIALSLVSRPFTENLILSIGNEFQKRTDWHRRRPSAS